MTNSGYSGPGFSRPVSLTLQDLTFRLPDGSALFSQLNEQFDRRPTGLVGRNGIGKSVLARILAGQLAPSGGRCLRTGTTYYLAQQISQKPDETVADLAGIRQTLDALQRIEAGSTAAADFDILGERWQIRETLRQALSACDLDDLHAETPAMQLSGGEAMRVALVGAFLSSADMLILDEPSNHLDRAHRRWLFEQLQQWRGSLIVVSHDRQLLEIMDRIVELSALGLRSYGGGYSFYAQTKAAERAQQQALLDRRQYELKRGERELSLQRERQERRQARGAKQAAQANQAPILLGLQKSRSQVSAGKLRARGAVARETLVQGVRVAAQQLENDASPVLFAPEDQPAPRRVADVRQLLLPHVGDRLPPLNLRLLSTSRLAVVGANGSGKSTLLKVLAGQMKSAAGDCEAFVETAYLDQHLSLLDAQQSILVQLLAVNRSGEESSLRSRLALLGLDAGRVQLPTAELSGGERIKAALARVLYAERPAQLLLLDEPDNHLDLSAVTALEDMLRQYRGTLVVVSHDEAFLDRLDLKEQLAITPQGWRLTAIEG